MRNVFFIGTQGGKCDSFFHLQCCQSDCANKIDMNTFCSADACQEASIISMAVAAQSVDIIVPESVEAVAALNARAAKVLNLRRHPSLLIC